ncbi:MAG: HU family DNA-binding protein [Parcubacteria group bacterium]|nr:HU family DNA-binding protein [Parcubacteria group bacterium]
MNKVQLSGVIAEKCKTTKAEAEKMLDVAVDTIIKTLKAGSDVTLTGFGTFSARKRKGRVGVHPRNPKEAINIPAVIVAKFKSGKRLKDVLKGQRDA